MNLDLDTRGGVVNARRLIFGGCVLAHVIMFAGIYFIFS
jgi:hypothetical protein